jgi:hypothetical protein
MRTPVLTWLAHFATASAPLRYQLLWLLAGPLAALLHECGHALAAAHLTPHAAQDRVTVKRWAIPISSGRFHAVLRPFAGAPSDRFLARTEAARCAAVIAAGPLASLAGFLVSLAIASGASPSGFRGQLFGTLALCCLSSVLNLIPMRIGGLASDGAQLVRALRTPPKPRPAANLARDPNAATSVAPPGAAAG